MLLIACNSSNLKADSPFQGFKGGVSIGLSAQKGSRDVKRSPSYLGGSGLADGFGGDLHPWAWPQDRGRASLLNEYRAQQHADARRMRRALNALRVAAQAAAAERVAAEREQRMRVLRQTRRIVQRRSEEQPIRASADEAAAPWQYAKR